MKTIDYLEALKAAKSLKTDGDLHRLTGWSRARISNYRNQGRAMDPDAAILTAEILGIDPGQVLADMEAEKATSDKAREAWHRVANRFAQVAGFVGLLVVANLAENIDFSGLHTLSAQADEFGSMYIMLSLAAAMIAGSTLWKLWLATTCYLNRFILHIHRLLHP